MKSIPRQSNTMSDMLSQLKYEVFSSLNCMMIGEIVSFDVSKKAAVVKLKIKHVDDDGKFKEIPLLLDCPVFTLQGGGGSIRFPVQAGDSCLVFFSDRSIDEWYITGQSAAPENPRLHDINDGIVFVGVNSLADSSINDYDDNINIDIPAEKKLVVSGTSATVEILGTYALAKLSELQDTIDWLKTHIHDGVTAGPGVSGPPSITMPGPTDAVGTQKLKAS